MILILILRKSFQIRIDESRLSCHSKVTHWTINCYFIQLVLEQVLFNRKYSFQVLHLQWRHMHDWTDVKFINPMGLFAHTQNGSFAVFVRKRNELFQQLFLIFLRILFPVVKLHLLLFQHGLLNVLKKLFQGICSKFKHLSTELNSLIAFSFLVWRFQRLPNVNV